MAKSRKHYKKRNDLCHKYGIDIISLDCDGVTEALIPTWIENGVNVLFPIEIGVWGDQFEAARATHGREVLGVGSFAGIEIPFLVNYKIPLLAQAPGGFLVYGILIAIMNKLTEKKGGVKKKSFSCEGCPSAGACGGCTSLDSKEEVK